MYKVNKKEAMDTTKAIEAIEELKSKLENIYTTDAFNSWLIVAKGTLSICIPNSDNPMPIRNVVNISGKVLDNSHKMRAIDILDGYITNLKRFDYIPKENEKSVSPITLQVKQYNNQNQTANLTMNLSLVFDALTDELNGSQLKELRAILESEDEPEQKKRSFMDKLKGFGENVASNVLVNLLSNPQIYGQLLENFK